MINCCNKFFSRRFTKILLYTAFLKLERLLELAKIGLKVMVLIIKSTLDKLHKKTLISSAVVLEKEIF